MSDHRSDAQSLQDRLRFKWADNGAGYNTEFTRDLCEAADLIDRQAKALLDAMAELDQLREAVQRHNADCVSLCGVGDAEGVRCGYRRYFPRRCPECPRDWIIEGSPSSATGTRS